MPGAQLLGKGLGPFQLGSGLRRAEHRHSGSAQAVSQPVYQRRFRPDHDQPDALRGAEFHDLGMIAKIECDQFGMIGYARVARTGEQFRAQAGLRQLPRQRMFAATRTDQQDIHVSAALF